MEMQKKPTATLAHKTVLAPQRRFDVPSSAAGEQSVVSRQLSATNGYSFSQVPVQRVPESAQSCPLATPRTCPFGGACHACPARAQTKLAVGCLGRRMAAQSSLPFVDEVISQEILPTRDYLRTGRGEEVAVETKIERPSSAQKAAILSDASEAEMVPVEGDTPVRMAETDAGTGAASATPSAGGCTYSITYANVTTPGCSGGKCGAKIVYDVTGVTATGSGCPASLAGLQLTESVTTDNGCGPGAVTTGAGCPIGAGGTIAGCTDTYGLCSSAAYYPAAGCTETYTQRLSVGGVLAETRTITFRITKTGGACSGTVART
jgi:hypothetical protein